MSVEDTTLLYSIDHPDPENSFTVIVIPLNEVGVGQPATSEPFFFPFLLGRFVLEGLCCQTIKNIFCCYYCTLQNCFQEIGLLVAYKDKNEAYKNL